MATRRRANKAASQILMRNIISDLRSQRGLPVPERDCKNRCLWVNLGARIQALQRFWVLVSLLAANYERLSIARSSGWPQVDLPFALPQRISCED